MDMKTPDQNIPEQRLDIGTTSTNKSLGGPPRPRDLSEGPGRGGQMYRGERALASEAALLGAHLSQKLKGYILFRHTGLGQRVGSSQFGAWHLAQGFPLCPFIISATMGPRDILLHVSY